MAPDRPPFVPFCLGLWLGGFAVALAAALGVQPVSVALALAPWFLGRAGLRDQAMLLGGLALVVDLLGSHVAGTSALLFAGGFALANRFRAGLAEPTTAAHAALAGRFAVGVLGTAMVLRLMGALGDGPWLIAVAMPLAITSAAAGLAAVVGGMRRAGNGPRGVDVARLPGWSDA